VSKAFGGHRALSNVDLSVEKGEIYAILGPSGCGKTTLLRIIAGLELPDKGRVFLGSRELTRLPASQRPVNMVFQSYALFPHLNVHDNVAFGLRAKKVSDREVKARVADILELMQMGGLETRRPHELSGGQKQRVALARALVNEPEILLLDEPMSALDAHLRGQVQDELRSLQKRLGTTFVLVTHDQNEAKMLSNKLAIMDGGEMVQFGPTQQVYSKPQTTFVAEFLGASKKNIIDARHLSDMSYSTPFGVMDFHEKPAWDIGKMLIWPDRIEIHEEARPAVADESGNWFEATVYDPVFNGQGLDLHLLRSPDDSFTGGAVSVKARTSKYLTEGQRVAVRFPPENIVPLDKYSLS
jgi:spermidine/putrescine transport system ATP-binding protein